jgi:uracil-DNA glycosylase
MVNLDNDWDILLADEFAKPYYKQLRRFLKSEYSSHTIYPDMYHIYEALMLTPFEKTKVVILGQDPYHGAGQAHGLCFSVLDGVAPPPSLENIFKELANEYPGYGWPTHGCLDSWALQGVLLLNAVLSVRAGMAASHRGKGWEKLTDRIVQLLGEREKPMVFMLWGADARSKKALIKNKAHLILEAPHPSPLSAYRGFFGCGHFIKANEFLVSNGEAPIDWSLV